MSEGSAIFGFQIHHIFPREIFDNITIGPALTALFNGQSQGLSLNMEGNSIALFANETTATQVQEATANGSTLFTDAGFGAAVHNGSHPGYTKFISDQIDSILTDSSLSPDNQRTALFDLQRFATEVSKGTEIYNGQPLTVAGVTNYSAVLESAWNLKRIDPTDAAAVSNSGLDSYINNFNTTPLDVGLNSNTQARFNAVENLANVALSSNDLSQAQYDNILGKLDALRADVVASGTSAANVGGKISAIGIGLNFDIAKSTGIGDTESLTSVFQNALANFSSNESGALSTAKFDSAISSITSLSEGISTYPGQLVSNLGQLDSSNLSAMANSFSSVMVGVGGGFVGDTAEFLNLAYDAIKTGIDGGGWDDFHDAVLQFGIAAVLSAAVITVTTVGASAIFGPVVGSLVGSAWAAYGIYDGLTNIAKFIGTVLSDGDYWGELFQDWLTNLEDLFNMIPIDPLVIDLDGDGIELTALDGSTAHFDLDGDGFAEKTGWVSQDDALLAIDVNGNGQVDDISELFGSDTQTGYEELQAFDSNGDGVVDVQDTSFGSLLLWQDLNGDGISDAGELKTLSEAGVTSISLNVTETPPNTEVNGNQIVETSTVTFADGTTTESGEVLLNVSQVETSYIIPEGFTYDQDVFKLPTLRGLGEIPDLWVGMTQDANLKTSAEGLIGQARAGNFTSYSADFDNFLTDWAGVENAIWMEDAPNLSAWFAYDSQEWQTYLDEHPELVDPVGEPFEADLPDIAGYVFVPGMQTGAELSDEEIQDWANERGFAVPELVNLGGTGFSHSVVVNSTGGFLGAANINGTRGIGISAEASETTSPDFAPTKFAFLQKIMGQDYRDASNFIAPEHILIASLDEAVITQLEQAYTEVKDYMTTRFLAQSAWSIQSTEGDSADVGALAPFLNIYYDPFTDKVEGNVKGLVIDLIEMFRTDGYGTDLDALNILRSFQVDFPEIGALVAANFTDIDRGDIETTFNIGPILEGDATANEIADPVATILLGHGGDDTMTGSSGDDILVGGDGNDSLKGAEGDDIYLVSKDQGDDRIQEWGNFVNDRIIFDWGITLADLQIAATDTDGNGQKDLTISFANGTGSITIEEIFRTESWAHDRQVDWFEFADGTVLSHDDFMTAVYHNGSAGDDVLEGTKNNDTFTGSAGNDLYRGSHGDDTYLVDKDQGDDRILEWGNYQNDRIVFAAGITLADLQAAATDTDGNGQKDLTISFANGTGSITIEEVFRTQSWAHDRQVDWFEFDDGTVLSHEDFMTAVYHNGTAGDDVLEGTKNNDTFTGSAGNDRYLGSYGDDTYLVDKDQGDDRILEWGNYQNDRIVFAAGIRLDDLLITDTDTDGDGYKDLTISFTNGTGSITIEEVFRTESWAQDRQVDWFEFADGTILDYQDIQDKQFADSVQANGDTIDITAALRGFVSVTSSTSAWGGVNAEIVDGLSGSDNYAHTLDGSNEWFQIDLGGEFSLSSVRITNIDSSYAARLDGATVTLLNASGSVVHTYAPISGATPDSVHDLDLSSHQDAQFIRINHSNQFLHVSEVQAFGSSGSNGQAISQIAGHSLDLTAALRGFVSVTSSTSAWGGENAEIVDGLSGSDNYAHTLDGANEWFQIDLGGEYSLSSVRITNIDSSQAARLDGATVTLLNASGSVVHTYAPISGATPDSVHDLDLSSHQDAQFIRINHSNQFLHVSEVQAFGSLAKIQTDGPGNNALEGGDGFDHFIFTAGGGTDTISGYDVADDAIQFNGLQFVDLTITQNGTDVDIAYGSGDLVKVLAANAADFTEPELTFA